MDLSSPPPPGDNGIGAGMIVAGIFGTIATLGVVIWFFQKCQYTITINSKSSTEHSQPSTQPFTTLQDSQIEMTTVEKFLHEIAGEKPIRFSPEQLLGFTRNYATKLGSGGFGIVYKGELPNGVLVAAKVLNRNKRVEEQFMAEIATMARTYHINLVRLYGFCFDKTVAALVYEYLENRSLDRYLFNRNIKIEEKKLYEIVIGTAKGIRYLHEECKDKIIHYDIKPANILLDDNFLPKVADFGLAKLCSRTNTHVSMEGPIGTPGYAAPEMWNNRHVTEKCDVFSFGIFLFEVVGKRRHFDVNQTAESLQRFPMWVWKKYESNQLKEIASMCGIEEEEQENAERMCKVALWCIQYQPEARPPMSRIVKMLEGEMEIAPPMNPFPTDDPIEECCSNGAWYLSASKETVDPHKNECTPIMRKYEIEIATSS